MARWMVAGQTLSAGRALSRAASTMRRRSTRAAARAPNSGDAGARLEGDVVVPLRRRERLCPRLSVGVLDQIALGVLEQHLDLPLGLLQLAVAQTRQLNPLLVEPQRLLEGKFSLL